MKTIPDAETVPFPQQYDPTLQDQKIEALQTAERISADGQYHGPEPWTLCRYPVGATGVIGPMGVAIPRVRSDKEYDRDDALRLQEAKAQHAAGLAQMRRDLDSQKADADQLAAELSERRAEIDSVHAPETRDEAATLAALVRVAHGVESRLAPAYSSAAHTRVVLADEQKRKVVIVPTWRPVFSMPERRILEQERAFLFKEQTAGPGMEPSRRDVPIRAIGDPNGAAWKKFGGRSDVVSQPPLGAYAGVAVMERRPGFAKPAKGRPRMPAFGKLTASARKRLAEYLCPPGSGATVGSRALYPDEQPAIDAIDRRRRQGAGPGVAGSQRRIDWDKIDRAGRTARDRRRAGADMTACTGIQTTVTPAKQRGPSRIAVAQARLRAMGLR